MRALARVLLDKGWRLSGSDLAIGCDDPLIKAGIRCFSGHAADQVSTDVECVIYSSAISAGNPELRRAAELGIPVLSYAEMLGRLMQGHYGLAVAGTHGKSTTTAMAAEILVAAGCDPTVVYGAAPRGGGDGGRAGKGNVVLVEACEFRRNFLHSLPPRRGDPEYRARSFRLLRIPRGPRIGVRPFCGPAAGRRPLDCALRRCGRWSCRRRRPAAGSRLLGWRNRQTGWLPVCEGRQGRYGFDLVYHGRNLGRIELSVFGRHNVVNALAAAALAAGCGIAGRKKSSRDFRSFAVCAAGWSRWERRAGSSFGTITHTTPRKFPLPCKRFARFPQGRGFAACFNPTRRCGRHVYWTNWPSACKMPRGC